MATYTVKSGETLSSIGKRLGIDWRKITGFRSGNPNLIYPGETLTIPDSGQQQPQQQSQQQAQVNTPETQAQSLIQTSIDAYGKKADEYASKSKEFDEKNPWSFDKVLAEEQAKAGQRLDPYYNQTLSDYLQGVNIRRTRGAEDERRLLSELTTDTDKVQGEQKIQLDAALERSREGFADAGLYGSGKQIRETGNIETLGKQGEEEQLAGTKKREEDIKRTSARGLEDLSLDETMKRRDLERERKFQTEQASLSEVLRRQKQRDFEKGQFTGAYPGVNPTQYQNSLYGFLGA